MGTGFLAERMLPMTNFDSFHSEPKFVSFADMGDSAEKIL